MFKNTYLYLGFYPTSVSLNSSNKFNGFFSYKIFNEFLYELLDFETLDKLLNVINDLRLKNYVYVKDKLIKQIDCPIPNNILIDFKKIKNMKYYLTKDNINTIKAYYPKDFLEFIEGFEETNLIIYTRELSKNIIKEYDLVEI